MLGVTVNEIAVKLHKKEIPDNEKNIFPYNSYISLYLDSFLNKALTSKLV